MDPAPIAMCAIKIFSLIQKTAQFGVKWAVFVCFVVLCRSVLIFSFVLNKQLFQNILLMVICIYIKNYSLIKVLFFSED